MTRWYRAYEGTVTDAKLGEVALVAGCSRSVAIAAWHCILESCASTNEKGRFDTTPRRCAVILQEPIATIEAVFAEFAALGLIEGSTVSAWSKRQFESDSSRERVKKHRATSRNADETSCNGDVTLQERFVTPPESESYTETETEKSRVVPRDEPASLETKLREAAGWQSEPAPGLFVTGPIQTLLDNGASLELDVLPVIRGRAKGCRRASSWKYFIPAIQDAVESRRNAATGPPPKFGNGAAPPQKTFDELRKELLPEWNPGTKFASNIG
jgi:hypothetical protein